MKIYIEYCLKWNYGPDFDRVSKTFKALNPNIIITSNKTTPRSGAFEITLNNKLVYSKFKTGSFPTKKEIENLIK